MVSLLGKAHDRSSEIGLWLGVAALAAVASLSFVATMSRYFLSAPIGWVPDWAGYLLAASVFVAAPAVTRRGQHVAMDILATYFTAPAAQRFLASVALVLTLVVLATMSWVVWQSLIAAYRAGTWTAAGYPIPRWWLLAFVFYGFASSSVHVLRILCEVLGGKPADLAVPHPDPEGF